MPLPDQMIEETHALGIPFIDVFSAFRRLPMDNIDGLFIAEGHVDYPGAAGHFNEQGNALAARMIYDGVRPLLAPRQVAP